MTDQSKRPVALVTGAGRGIGRALVRRLLAEGYTVWAFDNDEVALEALPSVCEAESDRLWPCVGDVGEETAVTACMTRIEQAHGHLHLLVNNAGIADPFNGPIEALPLADWERVLRVNLTGFFLMSKHAVPLLRPVRGCIVNMASSRAYQSEPQTEAYAASKGGIQALTHALAMSLGPEIRVNAIAPG